MENWTNVEIKTKFETKVFRYGNVTKANDRRQMVANVCGSWIRDHQLKLGRDYFVEPVQGPRKEYDTLLVKFREPRVAVLFKLTWGGQ